MTLAVTTSRNPDKALVSRARSVARELGGRFIPRDDAPLSELIAAHGAVAVVEDCRVVLHYEGGQLFFHPGLAQVRVERLAGGGRDPMVDVMGLQPGDAVLDCTLGLGGDALVASYAVGQAGRVIGLESSEVVAGLTRIGLREYESGLPDLDAAMRRVEVVAQDHLEYLRSCPDRFFDVVYFDPMFRNPVELSHGIDGLRGLANPSPVTPEAVREARRVARRCVVLKERRGSSEFSRLGFVEVERRGRRFSYGVIDTSREVDYSKPPLVAIVGPTAVGKTALSIVVAKAIDGEVVSMDSMQVYRHMNIGTAKPTVEERQGVPHHLIDVVDPGEEFSAARYQELASAAIQDILARGKIPMLVGGTGLYLKAVVDGLLFPDQGKAPEIRARLEKEVEERGSRALHERLAQVDPDAAARIHPNDARRIVRALEVYEATGTPITVLQRRHSAASGEKRYRLAMIGLTRERENLYRRVNDRVDEQVARGLVEETKKLMAMGFSERLVAHQALGYKEMIPYIKGEKTLEEAKETLKMETRRYAKRQLTWFRADKRVEWVNLDKFPSFDAACDRIIRLIKGKLGMA